MRRLTTIGVIVGAALCAAMPAYPVPPDAGSALTPFEAVYTITRGRLRIGELSMRLEPPVEGVWRYRSASEASGLVAMFTDVSIVEQSTFRVEDGLPVPLSHDYRMPGSEKNRDFSLAFDWVEREARGVVRGEPAAEPLAPGAVDRHTATIAMAAATAGARAFPFEFVMIDRARTRRYDATLQGVQTLETAAGRIETVRALLVRVGEPERQFRFWFAPELGHLPVRIQSVDDDGKTVTLQLLRYPLHADS